MAVMPDQIDFSEYQARIFKPVALTKYRWCQGMGHRYQDPTCPGRGLTELAKNVQIIRGGRNPLSNLYGCPKGCTLDVDGENYVLSEHLYQVCRLCFHDKYEAAVQVMDIPTGFKAMQIVHEQLPSSESSEDWIKVAN